MNILFIIPSLGDCWRPAVDSILKEKHPGTFILVVEDDCTEESFAALEWQWNVCVWKRQGRHYAAKNIYDGIRKAEIFGLSDNSVVAIVDGDDELHPGAIKRLVKEYENKNVWLTYGSYIRKSDGSLIGRPYPRGCDIRTEKWRGRHLRTMRYDLFRIIPERCFKGPGGNWLTVCYDLGIMFPAMEMAGDNRIRFIQKPMYIYNDLNPLNDHKVRGEEQATVDMWIRAQPRFKRIEQKNPRASQIRIHTKKRSDYILQLDSSGKIVGRYRSQREASDSTGIHPTCIADCYRGQQKTAGKYRWILLKGDR